MKNNYKIIKNKIALIEDENKKLNMRIKLIEKEKNDKLNKNNVKEKIENNNENEENLFEVILYLILVIIYFPFCFNESFLS